MTATFADPRIAPDVEIVEGRVPSRLSGGVAAGPLAMAAPGRYLLSLPGVGRFLVERGRRVTVARAPGAADADVACFLAGPVRQAWWLQRGRFAVRGCGVVVDGRAILITGEAAGGKSTTAAALALRGHRVLGDGAVPVSADPVPRAHPADDTVALWPRAMGLLGLDPRGGGPVRPGLAKRRVPVPAAADPTVLAAVVSLHRHADVGAPTARPAGGMAGPAVLIDHTALRPAVGALVGLPAHFRWATAIAAAVPVVELCVDRHRGDVAAVADALESLAAGAP